MAQIHDLNTTPHTMSARILIVHDDPSFVNRLSSLMFSKGFEVQYCSDGQSGALMALTEAFDLILLNIQLPKLDGLSVLKQLRQSLQTPVLMLSACSSEEKRIEGFQNGADDCLSQPFSFTEVVLRTEALLRRTYRAAPVTSTEKPIGLADDSLQLDRAQQKVSFAGKKIKLTPVEFRLMWALVESRNEVLAKRHLYETVLQRSFGRYDRSLDMHVSRIRRKLVEAGMAADRLTTVHSKGYLFA